METLIENTAAPSVDVPRLVLPWPDSEGWWWCRAKSGWMPGDELCVEATKVGTEPAIIHYGRDYYFKHDVSPTFADMEWIKAPPSPWQNDSALPEAGRKPTPTP